MTISDDGALRRFSKEWIGHHWMPLVLGWCLITLPEVWLPDTWARRGLNILLFLPIMPVLLLGWAHEEKMCEPCTAKMPLDAAAQAVKRRRTLKANHLLIDGRRIPRTRLTWAYLGFLVILFGPLLALPTTPGWQLVETAYSAVLFVAIIWAGRTHRRLQPWCRWCDWGKRGKKEPSPEPTPSRGLVPSSGA